MAVNPRGSKRGLHFYHPVESDPEGSEEGLIFTKGESVRMFIFILKGPAGREGSVTHCCAVCNTVMKAEITPH